LLEQPDKQALAICSFHNKLDVRLIRNVPTNHYKMFFIPIRISGYKNATRTQASIFPNQ